MDGEGSGGIRGAGWWWVVVVTRVVRVIGTYLQQRSYLVDTHNGCRLTQGTTSRKRERERVCESENQRARVSEKDQETTRVNECERQRVRICARVCVRGERKRESEREDRP